MVYSYTFQHVNKFFARSKIPAWRVCTAIQQCNNTVAIKDKHTSNKSS